MKISTRCFAPLTLIIIALCAALVFTVFRTVNLLNNHWQTYSQHSFEISELVTFLKTELGPEGTLYNFSNKMIQLDQDHYQHTKEKLILIRNHLNVLQNYSLTLNELSALEELQRHVALYDQMLEQHYQNLIQGKDQTRVKNLSILDNSQVKTLLTVLAESHPLSHKGSKDLADESISTAIKLLIISGLVIPAFVISACLIFTYARREKKIRQESEHNKDALEAALNSTPNAMFISAPSGQILNVNQEACALFEYPAEQILTMDINQLVEESDLKSLYNDLNTGNILSVHTEHRSYQLSGKTKSEKRFPIEMRITKFQYQNSTAFISTVSDISERLENEELLKKNQQLLLDSQRIANLGSWEWFSDGSPMNISEQTAIMLGLTEDQIVNSTNLLDHVHPHDLEQVMSEFEVAIKNKQHFSFEHRVLTNSGKEIVVREHGEAKDLGDRTCLIGTMQDISNFKLAEARLTQSSIAFDNTNDAIVITDHNNHIISVNKAFTEITGYTAEEVIDKDPGFSKSDRHSEEFFTAMRDELKKKGRWQGEIYDIRKNGTVYPKWISINAVKNERRKVTNYVSVYSDVTALKEAEEKLKTLAYNDELTGLHNRHYFQTQLHRTLARANRVGSKLAVLFMDLDRFKSVNDSLGHPAGDELLKVVANRIKNSLRESDLCARLGGDEFVVLIEHFNEPDVVIKVSEKIINALSQPATIHNTEVQVGTSIGVSVYPGDGEDATTLIKHADSAMYLAKKQVNQKVVFYSEDLGSNAYRHFDLEMKLRKAIEEEQFFLEYQPQVNCETGKTGTLEALVRWQHPEDGLIPPYDFIPVAEETGLIIPITHWILKEVCHQINVWKKEENISPVPISINISGKHIQYGELAKDVKTALALQRLEPHWIELELTETSVMTNAEQTLASLAELKQYGLPMSIDDFGTGYSSLQYLKQFPVTKLKIDRAFVKELPHNANDVSIVQAILAMAKSLNLAITAEGVETTEQAEFIKRLGCDYIQGYVYARPMRAEMVAAQFLTSPRLELGNL